MIMAFSHLSIIMTIFHLPTYPRNVPPEIAGLMITADENPLVSHNKAGY